MRWAISAPRKYEIPAYVPAQPMPAVSAETADHICSTRLRVRIGSAFGQSPVPQMCVRCLVPGTRSMDRTMAVNLWAV